MYHGLTSWKMDLSTNIITLHHLQLETLTNSSEIIILTIWTDQLITHWKSSGILLRHSWIHDHWVIKKNLKNIEKEYEMMSQSLNTNS